MDERVRKAFTYANLHLQQRLEFWTTHNNKEAIEHYRSEITKLNANFDELFIESQVSSVV